ncbi:MAG: DMT family transporter [Longimicrobiaceae bacterium]
MNPRLVPVYGALIVVQILFATLPVAIKLALRDLSSPSLALLRVSGAALCFLILHLVTRPERVASAADYGRLFLYALFGVILNQLLYITALTLTTATAAQTLITAGPALTLLAAISLRRERGSGGKWAGIALACLGALLLVGAEVGGGAGLGNLLVLLNVASFSVYLVISRDLLERYDPLTVITWTFLFGAVGVAPVAALTGMEGLGGTSSLTWAALAWIILVPTVGGYYLNVWALKRVESSVVAVFVYLQPMVTALLAAPVLGETVPVRLIPAALLIFAGVAVTAAEGWRVRRAPTG